MGSSMSVISFKNPGSEEVVMDDREYAKAARSGDEEAFSYLVRRYSGGLHRTVARVLSDETEAWDVVQMTYLKAWQQIKKYDSRWSFTTWLYRIGTNLAIDVMRSRKSRERTHHAGAEHRLRIVGESVPTSERVERQEISSVIHQLLVVLSPQQRSAFVLREVEGHDTAEVATMLGCSATTVRNHIFQARKVLRKKIQERYPEYLPAALRGENVL